MTQLDDGVGLDQRIARIGQADGLERSPAQGLMTALSHDLDGQAAVEIGHILPFLELGLGTVEQGLNKGLILLLVHGAIDIGRLVAAGAFLVIARLTPRNVHIDAVRMDDGGDGVEEGQLPLAGQVQDGLRQGRGSQGTGRDNDIVPVRWRQPLDLFAQNGDQGVGFEPGGDGRRKALPVHGQRAARRHLMDVGTAEDDRVAAAHLGMEQANGIMLPIVRPERVGTDQFGQSLGLMGLGAAHGAHLVQDDRHARLSRLPGRF